MEDNNSHHAPRCTASLATPADVDLRLSDTSLFHLPSWYRKTAWKSFHTTFIVQSISWWTQWICPRLYFFRNGELLHGAIFYVRSSTFRHCTSVLSTASVSLASDAVDVSFCWWSPTHWHCSNRSVASVGPSPYRGLGLGTSACSLTRILPSYTSYLLLRKNLHIASS